MERTAADTSIFSANSGETKARETQQPQMRAITTADREISHMMKETMTLQAGEEYTLWHYIIGGGAPH